MKILFVHQKFPGQFKFLAPALVQLGHEVVATTLQQFPKDSSGSTTWNGVRLVPYAVSQGTTPNVHRWARDFEAKTIRAEACFKASLALRREGFSPDIIIAHPGWGESLFLKDVWPAARLGIYCEFFYHPTGADVGFDPEFPATSDDTACYLRMKNLNSVLHFDMADAGLSPTRWQASTFPSVFRSKISVVHDGIDTDALKPDPTISPTLKTAGGDIVLSRNDELLTFVNRNLEPYRGYHRLMRALPKLLKERPKLRVLMVGGDDVSYGARPASGDTWKNIFIGEVRPQISDVDWQRVHFLGNLPYDTFIGLLQLSTVHVYLTYPFVLSWSLLEAMSIGCAIVASDTTPVHEAVIHDKTGRLVDFFDGDALVTEVCSLLADPSKRARLGAAARDFVRENFDLHRVCLPQQLAWVQQLAG